MTSYLDNSISLDDPRMASALEELSFWSSRFGNLLFDNLDIRGEIAILDVACGSGFPLFELAHTHGPSCRLMGVDLWQDGLERAAWKRGVYGLTNVSLARADVARLPFADGVFDLVVSNLGVNNFEEPQAVLLECARVAKRGARIVLTTNLNGHMAEFYEVFRDVLTEMWGDQYLERLTVNETHRGTKESVTALLEGAGFQVTKVVEDQFQMRFADGGALFRHFLVRVGFLPSWRAVVETEGEQAVFAALEARLNEQAREQGGLRLTVPMLYVEGRKP